MKLLPKIDIHVHTTEFKAFGGELEHTYASCDELLAMYDRMNIQYGNILPETANEGSSYVSTNEEVIRVVRKHPDRFGFFMSLDPRALHNSPDTNFDFLMDYYKRQGAKGAGEMCCNVWFDDPRAMNFFSYCEKHELPVIFHIGAPQNDYGMIDELGLPHLEKVLQTFPKLTILGHSQKFWAHISGDCDESVWNGYPTGKIKPGGRLIELLDKYPNLCCDISAGSGYNALTRDEKFGCEFIERYQDRVFFGTDICDPCNNMRHGEWLDAQVTAGNISYKAYEKVARRNALGLLKLDL